MGSRPEDRQYQTARDPLRNNHQNHHNGQRQSSPPLPPPHHDDNDDDGNTSDYEPYSIDDGTSKTRDPRRSHGRSRDRRSRSRPPRPDDANEVGLTSPVGDGRSGSHRDRNDGNDSKRHSDRDSPYRDGYSDRDSLPRDRYRDRDSPSRDRYRDRDSSPRDRYRDRDSSPRDRYRDRDSSPRDRYRDRDSSPRDRYRDRDSSPRDRYRDRDRHISDKNRRQEAVPYPCHEHEDRSSLDIRSNPLGGQGVDAAQDERRHPTTDLDDRKLQSANTNKGYEQDLTENGPPSPKPSRKDRLVQRVRNLVSKARGTDKVPVEDMERDSETRGRGRALNGALPGGWQEDEERLTTSELSPGLHRPRPRGEPPTHHSRSKDATPSASQGSIPNMEPTDTADSKKLIYGQDENEERGNWSGKFDFILSMLGYAVGLGNIWRFPYLCYRNGGGAFLFPFLLMMVVIGVPLFYLEASLGQFSSCGAMTCWEFAPIFKGLGIAMVMVSAMTGIYYNMILGWSLHFLFSSMTSDVPFASCTNDWNSNDCKLLLPTMTCEGTAKAADGRCLNEAGKEVGLWNQTLFTEVTKRVLKSPSKEYWDNVLDLSDGIENFGTPKWDLVLCLLLAWIICFFCLIKGIKTTGKVVYFTAIFPYVVLFILLIRGVTLENADLGIRYFITPDFGRLLDANVWKDAANQIFFSMSIAGGGLITLSSYNRFHNNILRDSMIVAIGDSITCILGGFVIFSFLGYMAGQLDVGIEDVAADGAGLAFEVYPEAVSSLHPTTLWALLFFCMLLTLGLDSQFAMIETVLTGVLDQFPRFRPRKVLVILSICIVLFILGLPLTTPGGMYLLQLMDTYVGGMTLIIVGFVELIAIAYVYGVIRFCRDINLMTGSSKFIFWKVTWCALSPATIFFIFVFMFVDYKASTYGSTYTYPAWADILGWFFTLVIVLAIPVVMLWKVGGEEEGKGYKEKFLLLCMPTIYWGPALKKHRRLVTYVSGFQVDPVQGLQPRTPFVNYGFSDVSTPPSVKTASQPSLGTSRLSVMSLASRTSTVTGRSATASDVFESNV